MRFFVDFWESPGRLLDVICVPVGALGVIFGSWDRLLKVLGQTFESNLQEKFDFAILTPL